MRGRNRGGSTRGRGDSFRGRGDMRNDDREHSEDDTSDTDTNDDDIEFSPTKDSNNVPAAFDFLDNLPGPDNEAVGVRDILECFHLFLPQDFYENVLQQTNLYADQTRASEHNIRPWIPVFIEELMAFIGLVIAMGVISLPSYRDYWSTDPVTAHFWFRRIMSQNRFMEIKRYLHMVDNSKIPATNTDKLYKIRPMITVLQERCLQMYSTHQQIAIDESMIGTKCHLSFLQYMPKKSIKWGIKTWVCSDFVTGYVYNFSVYTGADPSQPKHNKGLAYGVVMKLLESLYGKGYHVYMDNFYTGPILFKDLLDKKFAASGTCRVARKGFPKALVPISTLPRGMSCFQYYSNLTATHWRDKRDIYVLSTIIGDNTTKVCRRSGLEILLNVLKL